MAAKLSDYEKQALLSVVLAAAAATALIGQLALILRNFKPGDFEILYSSKGMGLPMIFGCTALAGALGATGFYLGFNSAGQNRNKKQGLSWMGFFLNAAVLTLTLAAFIFFWFAKEEVGAR